MLVSDLRFEWNERKNVENRRKHGVSFEEAQTVFFDECALLIDDPDHSSGEERFILLGLAPRCVTWLCAIAIERPVA